MRPSTASTARCSPSCWRRGARGRGVIVDQVRGLDAVTRLWDLGVDYLQGDALAAAGPRLDFDFAG